LVDRFTAKHFSVADFPLAEWPIITIRMGETLLPDDREIDINEDLDFGGEG
jgi:hypothetical protein